jgi:hypothetical protein
VVGDNAVDHARLVNEKYTNKEKVKKKRGRRVNKNDQKDDDALNNGHCEGDMLMFETPWIWSNPERGRSRILP